MTISPKIYNMLTTKPLTNTSSKPMLVLIQKYHTGKMMLGIGVKKLPIGVGIGQVRKKNTYTQNMYLPIVTPEILSVASITK
jgi:hypothetical protein